MPTATIPFADPSLISFGLWTTPATLNGRTAFKQAATNVLGNEIHLLVTGSSFNLPYTTTSATPARFTISDADGSNPVPVTPTLTTGTTWQDYVGTLTEGVPKRLVIKTLGNAISFDANAFITVTGTNPSIAVIPGWSTPATFTTAFKALCAPSQYKDVSYVSGTYANTLSLATVEAAMRLPGANLTGVAMFVSGSGKFRIARRDPVTKLYTYITATQTNTGTGYKLYEFNLGLSASETSELMIVSCGDTPVAFQSIMPIGGTFGSAKATGWKAGFIVALGASNTNGTAAGPQDSSVGGYLNKWMMLTNRPVFNLGIIGARVTGTGGLATLISRITDVVDVNREENIIFFENSRNDAVDGVSNADYQAGVTTELQIVVNATTVVPIYCALLTYKNGLANSIIDGHNAAITAAVAAVNNPRVKLVDLSPGYNKDIHLFDGTHYNDLGSTIIATNAIAATTPPPTTGGNGAISIFGSSLIGASGR